MSIKFVQQKSEEEKNELSQERNVGKVMSTLWRANVGKTCLLRINFGKNLLQTFLSLRQFFFISGSHSLSYGAHVWAAQ